MAPPPRIKKLRHDWDALIALVLVAALVVAAPDSIWNRTVDRVEQFPLIFGPILIALAGRFGIRIALAAKA